MQDLIVLVKLEMVHQGITEDDLANKMKVPVSEIKRWLNYKRVPNTEEVKKLLSVLNIEAKPFKKVWLIKEKKGFDYDRV